ncbi:A/G-specific adenine glycosylase [Armatimonas sp.]|uniref:A/G-specific adenine glycosylase n=1 Tax=Armatimonas sp. TaxID=1872638 RepID=UPI00374CEE7B
MSPFVSLLLDWYAVHKRALPWRRTSDPYAIWVSEMMLQQTQVATATPYFERWMARFPTVNALAEAPLEEVLKHWQGLGYYARARNLHKAAKLICEQLGGAFPTTYEGILALPGVGRYTAGAICSIALGLDTPIVDANVIRVLCRVFSIPGDPKSPKTLDALWEKAEELLPHGQSGDFNQALMELGALHCLTPPRCTHCPVQSVCTAFQQSQTEQFPAFAAKKAFTTHNDVSLWIERDEEFLLIKRPDEGLWGGLYELPRVTATPDETIEQAAARALEELVGATGSVGERLASLRHGVTTRKITLSALAVAVVRMPNPLPPGCLWATRTDLARYPLSSPQAKLLAAIQERKQQPALF